MKVIYLHQYFNTPDMTGGTRSYEMARRLVEWGHDVHMVTTWREPDGRRNWFQTEEAGIHVHWLPVPYSNHMGFTARIRAFIRFAVSAARRATSLEADVVFATSTPLTIVLPGLYAARKSRIPMVFEVRDLWPDVPIALGVLKSPVSKYLARKLELTAYRNSRRIVVLAPGMKEEVVKRGVEKEIVDVIPNGADLDLFYGRDIDIKTLYQKYQVPIDKKIIVYAGTLGRVNGVDYIIHLAAELQKQDDDEDIVFLIIGGGRESGALKALAKEQHVLNRTVVFLGEKSKNEVSALYHGCTASIMTYSGPEIVYRDSVSNKFFDSLAAGKPVLANFSGFSTKIAEQAGAGKILPSEPSLAVNQFLECLRNETWLASAGTAARRLAVERFSRDKLARDLEQVLIKATMGHDRVTGNSQV